MDRRQLADDFGLQAIRVLILIDKDITILTGNVRAGRFVKQQQLPQHHQQIVVVQELLLTLRRLIGFLEPTQILRMIRKMTELFQDDLVETTQRILAFADHFHDGPLAGKALVFFIQTELRSHQSDQILRIATIQNRESRFDTDRSAIPTQ